MRRRVFAIAAVVLAVLGGCATPGLQAPQSKSQTLQISGRLSLVSGPPDSQKALYGGFRLVLRGPDAGEFEVFSPLGQMLARAQWSPGQASLDDGRQTRTFASFEQMTRAALGVALPQAALQDWVQGKPASDLPVTRLADGGFEQLGWRVQPGWNDGNLARLQAQRVAGEPAQLRLVVEACAPASACAASGG